VLVGIVLVCLFLWLKPHYFPVSTAQTETTSTATAQTKLSKGTPDFKTFLPAGKTIDSYGGWTRVSPNSAEAVYAYSDTLFGTGITVSQQKLPASFMSDTEKKIQQLQSEQGYVTQHKIKSNGLTIYVGVSNKNYQSTIFVDEGILVLMTSYRPINDASIAEYIGSLR
jgi:hypothetical protein